jgi:hypothetical protein
MEGSRLEPGHRALRGEFGAAWTAGRVRSREVTVACALEGTAAGTSAP